jgi:hypothetical protein
VERRAQAFGRFAVPAAIFELPASDLAFALFACESWFVRTPKSDPLAVVPGACSLRLSEANGALFPSISCDKLVALAKSSIHAEEIYKLLA